MSGVPPEFIRRGPRPIAVKSKCRDCKLPYTAHSGSSCAICGVATEHHDADGFSQCLAGRARMAMARARAGVELNDLDLLVLKTSGIDDSEIAIPDSDH